MIFSRFLVEMETTSLEKDQLRVLINKLIEGDKQWFSDQHILATAKGPYWIVNYIQGKRTEYNHLVRGLVIQKPTTGWNGDPLSLIKSFPFTRFFNDKEPEAAPVDFNNADMLEKLDGSFVGVFFPYGDYRRPEFHTRKMLSTHEFDMNLTITTFRGKEANLMKLIKGYVDQIKFEPNDVTNTYVFEFIHEASKVLTQYKPEKYGLHLIGARNLESHREQTEAELNETAKKLGVQRAKSYDSILYHKQIEKMFELGNAEDKDFEGYIFRDRNTGKRIKVKSPDYVKKHHLLGNLSYSRLLGPWLEGEADEVIANFPEAKPRIEKIAEKYDAYVNKILNRVLFWKAKGLDGKTLSLALFGQQQLSSWEIRLKRLRGEPIEYPKAQEDTFTSNSILKYKNLAPNEIKDKIEKDLRVLALGQGKNLGSPKELLELIGMKDDEDSKTDVSEI